MINNTLKKFREAQYFLQLLRNKSQTMATQDEEFEFLLSAFLSSGRSVTFVLKKEVGEIYETFSKVWFDNLNEEEDDLCKFMKIQRNKVQKEGETDTEKIGNMIFSQSSIIPQLETLDIMEFTCLDLLGQKFTNLDIGSISL